MTWKSYIFRFRWEKNYKQSFGIVTHHFFNFLSMIALTICYWRKSTGNSCRPPRWGPQDKINRIREAQYVLQLASFDPTKNFFSVTGDFEFFNTKRHWIKYSNIKKFTLIENFVKLVYQNLNQPQNYFLNPLVVNTKCYWKLRKEIQILKFHMRILASVSVCGLKLVAMSSENACNRRA